MAHSRAACTIIAKNYLAFARTLVQSFLAYHPDYKFYVLIVDDYEEYINPADECFTVVKLVELEIPNLPGFCFKYDVKELCTASKAFLLEYLVREKSVHSLLYLDPDILVTGSLDDLYEKLGTYDIVLTPHLDTDYPADSLLPDDGHILRAGQFNLGFIGINDSDNAQSFLDWWKPKLFEKCVVDLLQGYFVDQKFIDFVPIFFRNVLIETDTGYNVAYWNLHSRRIGKENGAWKCNAGPLYFFHFSGYDLERAAISSHIPLSLARHLLSDRRELKSLFEWYKTQLIHNGQRQSCSWPYTFNSFKTGEPISYNTRRYYRSLPGKGRGLGDPFASTELKRHSDVAPTGVGSGNPTPVGTVSTNSGQLNDILNSRAWRWVSRYGRFKDRYFVPVKYLVGQLFGTQRAK